MSRSIEHNIFPDLDPRAEISEKTALIEKSWLDGTELGYPGHLTSLLGSFSFHRISGIQVKRDESDESLQPKALATHIFTACCSQRLPLIFSVHCRKCRICVQIGTIPSGEQALSGLLETVLGAQLFELKASDPPPLYRRCAAATGIPTHGLDKAGTKESRFPESSMDSIISGLIDGDWTYLVQAFPIIRAQTSAWFESCAREIKDIKAAFLLRDIQKADRMAQYYVEVLEKTIQRLKTGKQTGMWQTGVYLFTEQEQTLARAATVLASGFSGDKSGPEPLRTHVCSSAIGESPFINCCHSRELSTFISLPEREYNGFCLLEHAVFDVDFTQEASKPVVIGQIMAEGRESGQNCCVEADDLTRHALVTGVTGSGKTNTIFNQLKDLHGMYKIPFLVIEPAKAEYRVLMRDIDNLLVFTLGEERPGSSAPFRMNPFFFPEGVALQTHIDILKAVFNASFVMYAPMPYVLEDCLYRIYEEKGWNLVTSANIRGRCDAAFPTLADLHAKIDDVVEGIGYQDRTSMDIKAALKTRIRSLCLGGKGMMLNTHAGLPFDEIIQQPVVLELKYLGNDEEKAFMMGLILMALWEHYEAGQGRAQIQANGLRHLTVIEEAHRLLKNVPTEKTSEEQSNVKGKGIETFSNILSEIRTYGEGILVSEQIPTKLATDVIKNTNLKIMHRMVSKDDRDMLGDTMNLDQSQKRQTVSLKSGEAVFFREGLDRPLLVKVPLSGTKEEGILVRDTDVCSQMRSRFYDAKSTRLKRFQACSVCPIKDETACAHIRREVEAVCEGQDLAALGVRCFLPYLLESEKSGFREHVRIIAGIEGDFFTCFSLHLLEHYLHARGNIRKWPYSFVERCMNDIAGVIARDGDATELGIFLNGETQPADGRYRLCKQYCPQRCRFDYEGAVIARGALLHNRLSDLIRSEDCCSQGFAQNLHTIVNEALQTWLPEGQERFLPSLGVCCLLHKLDTLDIFPHVQEAILRNLSNFLRTKIAGSGQA